MIGEQVGLYDGIVDRQSNKAEGWIQLLLGAAREGRLKNIGDMLQMARIGGLDISTSWAIEVARDYMSCAKLKPSGELKLSPPSEAEAFAFRSDPSNDRLPFACSSRLWRDGCKCAMGESIRCPILFGERELVLERGNEGDRLVNFKPFPEVDLVIGDGHFIETAILAQQYPKKGFVIIDPLTVAGIEILKAPTWDNIQMVLEKFYSLDTTMTHPWEVDIMVNAMRIGARNIFPVQNTYESLERFAPEGYFSNVHLSFPYPEEEKKLRSRLPIILKRILKPSGQFVFRSEKVHIIESMAKALRDISGFKIETIDSDLLPITPYDIYLRSFYGQKAYAMCATKL